MCDDHEVKIIGARVIMPSGEVIPAKASKRGDGTILIEPCEPGAQQNLTVKVEWYECE